MVQQANGGTLLLDEVSELPREVQPKLLRLIAERQVRPVGGDRDIPIDVRLVAASNRDLAREVEEGRFRDDLYFRLNVVEIRLPPLRERVVDLPALCAHLLSRHGHPATGISRSAMARLCQHRWPGNVRELENELLRAMVMAGTGPIHERHLSPKLLQRGRAPGKGAGSLSARRATFDREVVKEALRDAGGNRSAAAKGPTRRSSPRPPTHGRRMADLLSLGFVPQGCGLSLGAPPR